LKAQAAAPKNAIDLLASSSANLITLERPFDLDEFSQQLGETIIRVVVPRENLKEVLDRVSDFMGFGIYVYSIAVRPSPNENLKSFEVELRRVDFSPARGTWEPFQDRGRSENPFGPGGDAGRRA
jgi:hypothetical protein